MKNSYMNKAVVFAVIAIFIAVACAPAIGSTSVASNKLKVVEPQSQQIEDILSNNQPILSPEELELKQRAAYRPTISNRGWYWKPPYPNYAPHTPGGMPDFDQKQDNWKTIHDGGNGIAETTAVGDDIQIVPAGGTVNPGGIVVAPGPNCKLDTAPAGDDVAKWAFCGPVAVANCFWWFDSKYADPTGTPGDGADEFPLVEDYGAGDDHAVNNAPLLIEELAGYMQTCEKGTTYIGDMQDAIDDWLIDVGLDEKFEENTYDKPDFDFIEAEIERSQDVILLLGYYDITWGDKIADQQQTIFDGNDNLNTATWWDYQSFVPTVSRLDAIQICLVSNGPPCDVEINVYDIAGGNPIGTTVMNPGPLAVPTWVQFHFDPFVSLVPGNIYYFDVRELETPDDYHYEWMYIPFDAYPPGQGWMDTMPTDYYGNPFDWTFITEYYDPYCIRMGGHYVTCAGVNSEEYMIAFSDPCWDVDNPSGDDHNDPQYVSHDRYTVDLYPPCLSLGYKWWLPGFPSDYYTIVEQAVVICPINDPPNKPSKPSGTINGKINVEYTYTSLATDPDGDQLYYLFDWGDGTDSGWLGPYNSSVTASAKHTWTVQGSYDIKVKARDVPLREESPWSDPLSVTMPLNQNQASGNSLILKFMQRLSQILPLSK